MSHNVSQRIKDLLWAVVFAGLVASILRFGSGLGAATGLNDATPWGLWIAFKLGFVALAGGGFTLAALVYVFHLETYRPILRRAILLALLGYGSFIVSLLFDLGLPWHIYMPILNWQHHSVMFEIAWCVMLYFSVLIMEFGPVILEHSWFRRPLFQKIAHFLHRAVVPLVIAGIVLSTLHQSSLGSLFLMMPHRVHPLWYSAWIPVMFFTSAIAAGLMALIVEGFLAWRIFGRSLHFNLLANLGKIGAIVLWLYLGIRLVDLALRGVLPSALDGSWQSILFMLEILLGGILPGLLLLVPKVRLSRPGLLTCALLAIGGVLSQRMSLSMVTLWRPESAPYHPSALEILIAFAIPAAAGLIYLLFVEQLAVFEEAAPSPAMSWSKLGVNSFGFVEDGSRANLTRRSGIAVIVVALVIAVLPPPTASGQLLPSSSVKPALGWEVLKINGDQDEVEVLFPHVDHQDRLADQQACQTCHHINRPDDEGTGCWACHSDNFRAQSIFDHTLHVPPLGNNAACQECHLEEHRAETAIACLECHDDMLPEPGELRFSYLAPGYQEAMHGRCLACHEEQAVSQDKPELAECAACHFQNIENSKFAEMIFDGN